MLTLPKSSTIGVHTTIDGQKQFLDLSTTITDIAPVLTTPTIIDLINNTYAPRPDKFTDIQFRCLAKAKPIYIYADGELKQDPAHINATDAEIGLKQIQPVEIGNKIILKDIDLQSDEALINTLSMHAANFLAQNRTATEVLAFSELAFAAQNIQSEIVAENEKAITFNLGAHVQKQSLSTAEQIRSAITNAKKVMKLIGTQKAKTAFDRNNKFVEGIDIENDVILLIDDSLKDTLIGLTGLISSDKGFEAFKNARLERIMGLTTYATSNLPNGVNFLLVTTGSHGAYAHNLVGDGFWSSFEPKDAWRKNIELQQSISQYQGVVYETYVVASFDEDVIIAKKTKQGLLKASTVTDLEGESYGLKSRSGEDNSDTEKEKTLLIKLADLLAKKEKEPAGTENSVEAPSNEETNNVNGNDDNA